MRSILISVVTLALAACSGNGNKDEADFSYLEVAAEQASAETAGAEDVRAADRGSPEEVVCTPDCEDKLCGPDGCGGECGQCPLANDTCEEGQCICIPSCANKFCGDNGCGGSCGVCDEKFVCLGAVCACIPSCEDKECGSDGCLGSCGFCDKPLVCKLYACQCSYGHCVPGDNLDEVCGGTSPGNCGEWQCVDGCCEVYQTPPPECCQTSEDCRDCINLETAETTDCPLAIPEGFVTDMCTDDVCGFGNKCKHFHKAVFGECNDDDDCTKDSCEPETGLCTHTPIEGCE